MAKKSKALRSAPISTPATPEATTEATETAPTETVQVVSTEAEAVRALEQGAAQVIGPVPEFATPPMPADEKKAKKEPKPQRELKGMMFELKKLVFAAPEETVDDLIGKLKDKGFATSKSSVSTLRADFLHSARVLDHLGVKGLKSIIK